MCGICLIFVQASTSVDVGRKTPEFSYVNWLEETGLLEPLQRRGPDSFGVHSHNLDTARSIHGAASVLHLRGTERIMKQPLVDKMDCIGSFLLFNGEIYGGMEKLTPHVNDTCVLFEHLNHVSTSDDQLKMVSLIAKLEGPFAMIYFDAHHQKLWFCRDAFGRRSLLYGFSNTISNACGLQSKLILSSVASQGHDITWSEVTAGLIFCLDFNISDGEELTIFRARQVDSTSSMDDLASKFAKHRLVQCTDTPWSGLFQLNRHLGAHSIESIVFDHSQNQCDDDAVERRYLEEYGQELDGFIRELRSAVRRRVILLDRQCQNCGPNGPGCDQSKVALLFSGGVDSLLLAILLAEMFQETGDSMDLLNVAFGDTPSAAPDRITGERGFKEIKRLYPESCQNWKFIRIDIDQQELSKWRHRRIAHLVHPLDTVLDDSIGCVLWFAARGIGHTDEITNVGTSYTCPNHVLLLGSGADELLAGYSRHRKRYFDMKDDQDRRQALIGELEMELERIGTRNLARDDRIVSDHGRESRLPYLDEQFVKYVNSLPLEAKTDLRLRRGIGDKLILRMALRRLGVGQECYRLPKRAMQFGTRIAKSENRKEKGGDRCVRLMQREEVQ